MSNNLVIVESPAKAKTINKYLGPDYTVMASYGHVRDLPPKDGSVRPDEDFAMSWQMDDRASKQVKEIVKAAKGAKKVFLATDPDREGEAISWHVQEILKEKKIADKVDIARVTFNEITKSAVQEAFEHARDLDTHLIDAYLARRALDYLVGFNISPVLWRKLPGSRSAGRVQSVALRLICEREAEIEIFNPQEYWSIEALFQTPKGEDFTARLTHLNGEKLDKLSIKNESAATAAVDAINGKDLSIDTIERKQVKRNPAPPFITSTLQQEASRKLGFSATQTMRTAQKLYEGIDIGGETVGLITYMRTDGITLSGEAIAQCRNVIQSKYSDKYLPSSPRAYKSKAKNAQEAHEAIRPTDMSRDPAMVRKFVGESEAKLYELIWKRTLACQMESAVLDQVSVDIQDSGQNVVLRATGSIIAFDGFLTLYRESRDDQDDRKDDENKRLPPLEEGMALKTQDITPNQHFTQPPPRYTEASLVKKMEELGIGRPSTYASILQVLQDRNYVVLEKKRFVPEDRGRIVTTFLMHFFRDYVEYDFTANMEDKLDDISAGGIAWRDTLRDFWTAFSEAVAQTKDLTITEVIDRLNEDLAEHFFPVTEDNPTPRECPTCDGGALSLKLGKFGAFVGCTNYPDCKYTKQLTAKQDDDPDAAALANEPKILGKDPKTGMDVSLRKGPYGPYVQLGPQDPEDKKEKPKRQSIPKGQPLAEVDLDIALKLLSLPRDVGHHPESKEMIQAGIGRYGPFLKHEGKFKSIPAGDDVLTIGLNRAVDILASAGSGRGGFGVLKELGDHPDGGGKVTVNKGRYGPYVKQGKLMASLPKDADPAGITIEQAVALLKEKAEKDATKGKGGKKPKKATKPKKTAKKKA